MNRFIQIKLLTLLLFTLIVLGGCVTGPVEDEEDPQVPEGPGLFSGDKGAFSFNDIFRDRSNDRRDGPRRGSANYPATYYDADIPAIDPQSFEEFELFKQWRRAQQPDSVDFQEYQDWRAYQQYRRYRAQQQENQEQQSTEQK